MSLIFGIVAAALWGLHDLLVRVVSRKLGVLTSLFWVILFGLLFLILFSPIYFSAMQISSILNLSNIFTTRTIFFSGIFFLIASFALFGAFKIGPVSIVAPIIGTYPLLSLLLSSFAGSYVQPIFWQLTLFVILGISIVAIATPVQADKKKMTLGSKGFHLKSRILTIFYSFIAAISFAFSFHFGQEAVRTINAFEVTFFSRIITFLLILLILIFFQKNFLPKGKDLLLLSLMGFLDVLALGLVFGAGNFQTPALAPVASSNFGLFTLILAYFILGEKLNFMQLFGIVCVFSCLTTILLV